MLNLDQTQSLYKLLSQYQQGELELFDLLDEGTRYFDSIRGVASWLTSEGKKDFDGYHFDDLVDYYNS